MSLLSSPLWQMSFGGSPFGVLADALLFYLAALLLLTHLGLGISSLLLPKALRCWGWLVAPCLGFSFLVVLSALFIAVGANVAISLAIAMAASTVTNLYTLRRRDGISEFGGPNGPLLLLALTLPCYLISAATMAHNGSLAYVGGQGDLYLLVPLAEWLKAHPAPLFSFNSDSLLSPFWNANVPQIGDWYRQEAHLSFAGHRADDANFLFQRGSRYFEAAIGLVLGWDSALVFRPAQAFALSLSLPAVFLFCRILVSASRTASVLAAVLAGLNGTLFFWVLFGHPGQAISLFLTPAAIVIALSALESRETPPLLAAVLVVSALLVSYYQGAPLLLFLLIPGAIHLAIKSGRRLRYAARGTLVGLGTLLLTLPEQLKLLLVLWTSGLPQTSGWNDSDFSPISDTLGTTLHSHALGIVAGQGQLGELGTTLLGYLSQAITCAAIIVAGIGLIFTKGLGLYRSLLLGGFALLVYLRLSGYPYGYSKAQAGITFLLAPAVALGLVASLRWASHTTMLGQVHTSIRRPMRLGAGVVALLLTATLAANLALSAYMFWKPVGNIWNPKTWETMELNRLLPTGTTTRVSPNILADPEAIWMALYSLRNQEVQGPYALRGMVVDLTVAPSKPSESWQQNPDFLMLGASEIAGTWGLVSADRVWAGSLVTVYRNALSTGRLAIQSPSSDISAATLPIRLPATIEYRSRITPPAKERRSPQADYLLVALAAESPNSIMVVSPGVV